MNLTRRGFASLPWLAALPAQPLPPGAGVQRTIAALAASSPRRRLPVRILFFGQSITKQDWWHTVTARLRARYPDAHLVAENRAIGGFAAPVLRRTLDHNVFPFAPDLIIFHVYGGEPDYEWIIREFRRRTSAEVLLVSDHITWLPEHGDPGDAARIQREAWQDRHSFEWLPRLASELHCGLAEIRRPWAARLRRERLAPSALLTDGVHLNERGNDWMAEFVLQQLVANPSHPVPAAAWVKEIPAAPEIRFTGRRVDLLTAPREHQPYARVEFFVDGKRPSEWPGNYAHLRMSDTPGVDWPFAIRVASAAPLAAEQWRLRVTEASPDGKRFRFEVEGSRTGRDGAGLNTERFVSKSGRVVIEPEDWWADKAYALRKVPLEPGFLVEWETAFLGLDHYEPRKSGDLSRVIALPIAVDLPVGDHELAVRFTAGVPAALDRFRIHQAML